MSFSSLGLSKPLLLAIEKQGYSKPTPVQNQAIPAILSGRDVLATAQTGTGKTASFILPLLQRLATGPKVKANQVRALVLTPTRELAQQVADSVANYGAGLPLKSSVIYGGVKINPQMMKLRGGADLLVATPGRLLDLYRQNAVHFSQLQSLVLDEADQMLNLGFITDISKILTLLPERRQNLLFSATFSSEIRTLADTLLDDPLLVELSPRGEAAATVAHLAFEVDKEKKPALLIHLLKSRAWQQVLVFVRTKNGADRLTKRLLREGINSAAIHGDKSQGARTRVLADFKANKLCVLVATDLAARGIDIRGLPHVVNFDLPKVTEDYVHRTGRTGRAGCKGEAITLVSADEVKMLSGVENQIRQTMQRKIEAGFEPAKPVPFTKLSDRPSKPKRPKKPKKKRAEPS